MVEGALLIRNNRLNLFGDRADYNVALRHFRSTQGISADLEEGYNLADLLNEALGEKAISDFQLRSIVKVLLVEKYGYVYASRNLAQGIRNIDSLGKTVKTWTNIQLVIVYSDGGGNVHVLNPENSGEWESLLPFIQGEYIVCYAGSLQEAKPSVLRSALNDFYSLLYGKKPKIKEGYTTGKRKKKFITPKAEVSSAPSVQSDYSSEDEEKQNEENHLSPPPAMVSGKLTSKIGVNVTNELFHNGNVEAWKRIIESYRFTYPDLGVLIWYEGELINDINALFKWGKVKHGVPIMFSVAGESPKDLSKLRKYLFEGASPRFESFLHVAPGSILQLF